jgi:predicted small lipoprotein YifL
MKKLLSLTMALITAMTLSACGKKAEEPVKSADYTPPVAAEPAEPAEPEEGGIVSSIRDALTGSATLKCEYTDEDGEKSIVYLKGQMVRIEGTTTEGTDTLGINGLVRDNKMYVWSANSTSGFLIDFSKIQPEDDTMKMGETPIHSSDDVVNELEAKGQNCERTSVADSYFDVPADIDWMGDLVQ